MSAGWLSAKRNLAKINLINKKIAKIIAGSLALYILSAGLSYMVFNRILQKPINFNTPFGTLADLTSGDEEGVKEKPCPLNGAMYTKNREETWRKRRPLGVMIENHVDARPAIGLSRVDVIYEAVAEGGITRFLAVFLCQDAGDIAPVRSARTYFLDWVSEYDALYAHVGGANTPGPANALGQIRDYGIMDMDQFGLGFPTYWRGTDKLAPHNVHSTTKKLWEAAEERKFGPEDEDGKRWDDNFVEWKFKDDASLNFHSTKLSSHLLPSSSSGPNFRSSAASQSFLVVECTLCGASLSVTRQYVGNPKPNWSMSIIP